MLRGERRGDQQVSGAKIAADQHRQFHLGVVLTDFLLGLAGHLGPLTPYHRRIPWLQTIVKRLPDIVATPELLMTPRRNPHLLKKGRCPAGDNPEASGSDRRVLYIQVFNSPTLRRHLLQKSCKCLISVSFEI